MRISQLNKSLLLLCIYIFSVSFSLAAIKPEDIDKEAFFIVDTIPSYTPIEVNYDNYQAYGSTRYNSKVIKILEYTNYITGNPNEAPGRLGIPSINLLNYTATLSKSDGSSSQCTVLVKSSIDYKDYGTVEHWFELDNLDDGDNDLTNAFLYNRSYYWDRATSFTITLYYLIKNPSNIINSTGTSTELLTLDPGPATDFYLYYFMYNTVNDFYSSTLISGIEATVPDNLDTSISSFLYVNANKPASWTVTSFFDNLYYNNLEWIVSLQAVLTTGVPSTEDYYIGLEVSSLNDFTLISNAPGTGIKQVPYTLRLSLDNSTSTIDVNETDKIRVEGISDNEIKDFYVYTYSTADTTDLNAGIFRDTIYLNFITDIDATYNNNKTITVF